MSWTTQDACNSGFSLIAVSNMVDVTAIVTAMSGLKAATDIAKGIFDIKSISEVQGKVIELQSVILVAQGSAMAAQSEQYSLQEKVRQLETDLAKLQSWETERDRYQLEELPPGILVYRLKPGFENGVPPHRICATCYNRGSKSLLHITDRGNGLTNGKCYSCSFEVQSGRFIEPQINRSNWMD